LVVLGVVSDTHDSYEAAEKVSKVLAERGAEYLVHLGDFISPPVFRRVFASWKGRGFAVAGNNDGEVELLLKAASDLGIVLRTYPYAIALGGRRIFLMHGFGGAEETREVAEAIARGGSFDLVLYGHTHIARAESVGGKLVLNPGEACGYLTGRRTAALVDLETMRAEIVDL